MGERKSAVLVEFPPVADGCAPTVRLTVTTPRKTMEPKIVDSCHYALTEIPAFEGERAFQFDRMDIDRPESWHVRYVNPFFIECTCIAGCRGHDCKHASAVRAVIQAEKFDPNNEAKTV